MNVGVMKDCKLRDLRASHTYSWVFFLALFSFLALWEGVHTVFAGMKTMAG
jgi:hypothetical protein